MPRHNYRVEQLERECDMLRKQIAARSIDPGDLPVAGCGDNSCVVARPGGMATNGGCRCDDRTLRWALSYYKRLAAFREETVHDLRDEVAGLRAEMAMGEDA